jgi:hypothetical protein
VVKTLKVYKPQINTKPMNEKKTSSIVLDINIIVVAIDNNMVVIQVHIGINMIDDVFSWGIWGKNYH